MPSMPLVGRGYDDSITLERKQFVDLGGGDFQIKAAAQGVQRRTVSSDYADASGLWMRS